MWPPPWGAVGTWDLSFVGGGGGGGGRTGGETATPGATGLNPGDMRPPVLLLVLLLAPR